MSYSQGYSQPVKKGDGYMQIAKNVTSEDYISFAPRKNLYRSSNHPLPESGGVTGPLKIDLSGQGNPPKKNRNLNDGIQQKKSRQLGQYGFKSSSPLHGTNTSIDLKEEFDHKLNLPSVDKSAFIKAENKAKHQDRLKEIETIERALRKRQERIDDLIQMRREYAFQRLYSPHKSHKSCNRHSIEDKSGGMVNLPVCLEVNKKDAKITGLMTCKSPYCRHLGCSWTRTINRAKIINHVVGNTLNRIEFENSNESVWFTTLTVKRTEHVDNAKLQMQYGWKAIKNHLDKKKRKSKGKFRYKTARGLDFTFKPFQRDVYHLHIHAVFIFSDNPTKEEVRNRIVRPWVNRLGESALQDCQDVKKVYYEGEDEHKGLGLYIAKGSCMGLEVSASSTTKTGNKGLSFAELVTLGTNHGGRYAEVYRDFLTNMKYSKTFKPSRNWEKVEDEDETEIEEPIFKVEIPRYWRHLVLKSVSVVTLIARVSAETNNFYILREFENLMSMKTDKEVENFCEEIGFSPFWLMSSKRYLWEQWFYESRRVLKLEHVFFPSTII